MAKCKNCTRLYRAYDEEAEVLVGKWCEKVLAHPDVEVERDCIFFNQMTNGDRIRRMTDEELADIVFCPYDTAGDPEEIMPCIKDGFESDFVGPDKCHDCMMKWLQEKVKE